MSFFFVSNVTTRQLLWGWNTYPLQMLLLPVATGSSKQHWLWNWCFALCGEITRSSKLTPSICTFLNIQIITYILFTSNSTLSNNDILINCVLNRTENSFEQQSVLGGSKWAMFEDLVRYYTTMCIENMQEIDK